MNYRIRIILAGALATLGMTLTSAPALADVKDQCSIDPNSGACLEQIADQQCADHGDGSVECLAARNAVLERRVASQSSWIDTLVAQFAAAVESAQTEAAALQRKVDRQAATIQRLRHRLNG